MSIIGWDVYQLHMYRVLLFCPENIVIFLTMSDL